MDEPKFYVAGELPKLGLAIDLVALSGAWGWRMHVGPDDSDRGPTHGPFETLDAAKADAERYFQKAIAKAGSR